MKLKKKLKEIQRLSFDYSGDFFNSKQSNPESTISGAAIMRASFSNDKTPKFHKKNIDLARMKTLGTKIENERLIEREEKKKAQRLLTESLEGYFKETSAAKFAKAMNENDTLS